MKDMKVEKLDLSPMDGNQSLAFIDQEITEEYKYSVEDFTGVSPPPEEEDNSPNPPKETNHPKPDHKCPKCETSFARSDVLKRHLFSHEATKPFKCDFCPMRFTSLYRLQLHHVKGHSKDLKPWKCKKCSKGFTLKTELKDHIKDERHLRLDSQVDQEDEFKEDLTATKDLREEEEEIESKKKFKCEICSKHFQYRYTLTSHLIRHESGSNYMYHCKVCELDCFNKTQLMSHLNAHEAEDNNNEQSFKCDDCLKQFKFEQSLEIHLKYHEDSLKYKFACELCELTFKSEGLLGRHLNGEFHLKKLNVKREFECCHCGRKFDKKSNLWRHELSHTHGRRKKKVTASSTKAKKASKNRRIEEKGDQELSILGLPWDSAKKCI